MNDVSSRSSARDSGGRPWTPRLDFEAAAPSFASAMAALGRTAEAEADRAGLSQSLRELVRLRASQLNGCAYCIDMHSKGARSAGESDQRLDALPAWREAPFFSEREEAALELAEAITLCAQGHVPEPVWATAARVFSAGELAALVSVVVTVNAWNHIGVATHAWLPGSYSP